MALGKALPARRGLPEPRGCPVRPGVVAVLVAPPVFPAAAVAVSAHPRRDLPAVRTAPVRNSNGNSDELRKQLDEIRRELRRANSGGDTPRPKGDDRRPEEPKEERPKRDGGGNRE